MIADPLSTLLFGVRVERKRPLPTGPSPPQPLPQPSEAAPKRAKTSPSLDLSGGAVQLYSDSAAPQATKDKKTKKKKKQSLAAARQEAAASARKALGVKAWGTDLPPPTAAWDDVAKAFPKRADVLRKLIGNVRKLGHSTPTPIQAQAIPLLLGGREVLGCAPTGSGKTIAFALPVLGALGPTPADHPALSPRAVLLAPTRELAAQIFHQLVALEEGLGTRVHLLSKEAKLSKSWRLDVVVTTPKRLLACLKSGEARLRLDKVGWLVLDESDKLFEEGGSGAFRDQLSEAHSAIAAAASGLRRAFFSATFSDEVQQWAAAYLDNLVTVTVGERNAAAATIRQEFVFTGTEAGKLTGMRAMVAKGLEPPLLVFVQSKDRAEQLELELGPLVGRGRVAALHGALKEEVREERVRAFRQGSVWLLVATELLGRGMDFVGVRTVVNWDCPLSRASYVHRIGRTGRAGAEGRAVTFVTEADRALLPPLAAVARSSGQSLPAFMQGLKKPSWQQRRKAKAKGGAGLKAPKRALISKDDRFERKPKGKKNKAKAETKAE